MNASVSSAMSFGFEYEDVDGHFIDAMEVAMIHRLEVQIDGHWVYVTGIDIARATFATYYTRNAYITAIGT